MVLGVNPDTVRFLIDKLRQFQVKDVGTYADPGDDWGVKVLADYADDPSAAEIRATIDDLDPEQQVEVVALAWVGRGDYTADEWDAAVDQARDGWNSRTADYLIGTPLSADFLEDGLDQLGFSDMSDDAT